ncbi:hypothetical protein [Streptomyces phytohabitans]
MRRESTETHELLLTVTGAAWQAADALTGEPHTRVLAAVGTTA